MLAMVIHGDDEKSIVNSCFLLLKYALLTMVWIVRNYMVITDISS
jgi:hypothetical protein